MQAQRCKDVLHLDIWKENLTRLQSHSLCEELEHVQHNTSFESVTPRLLGARRTLVHAHSSCPYAVRIRAAAAAQYDEVDRDNGSCAPKCCHRSRWALPLGGIGTRYDHGVAGVAIAFSNLNLHKIANNAAQRILCFQDAVAVEISACQIPNGSNSLGQQACTWLH